MDDSHGSKAPTGNNPTWRAKLVNFAIFQVVYFACVLGAAKGVAWIGPLAGLVLLPLNLFFVADRGRELRLWLLAGALGLALDSILLASGLIAFPDLARLAPEFGWPATLVPLWIVTLWVAFGSLLTSSLAWVGRNTSIAVLFGAVGGPFSFWSGTKIGATEIPGGWQGFVVLGVEYAVLLPILLRAANQPAADAPVEPPPGRSTRDVQPNATATS